MTTLDADTLIQEIIIANDAEGFTFNRWIYETDTSIPQSVSTYLYLENEGKV